MINEFEDLDKHSANGCNYGRPSGPDDNDECCDCDIIEEQQGGYSNALDYADMLRKEAKGEE